MIILYGIIAFVVLLFIGHTADQFFKKANWPNGGIIFTIALTAAILIMLKLWFGY